jgi:methionyl-tRNA synthetase
MATANSDSYYRTTPIYYVNGVPHLGTAYTTIAADTLARFERSVGHDTWFLTGLDEHGQKVAQSAEAAGVTPQEWVDGVAPKFLEAWSALNISNNDFIRTTQPRHIRGVQQFFQTLYSNGYIYKSTYKGWYCVPEETFYTPEELAKAAEAQAGDKPVATPEPAAASDDTSHPVTPCSDTGSVVIPAKAGTPDAANVTDVSDKSCSSNNNPPLCPDCGRPLTYTEEENLFFKLSAFQDKLLAYYDANPNFICPETRRNEVVSFVKGGLEDLSVSRTTFDWGVPVPFAPGHVSYVWVDALINYLTAVGYGDPTPEGQAEFARRWPAQIHFVGKDIIRFHCVIWPAMLMAAGLPLPKRVFAHGFLLTKGEKMSKSRGNAMSPADLCAIFGVDGYRYYFLSDVQFGADGSISLERMLQVYNADLANSWGNLCSRTLSMTGKYFEGRVPEVSAQVRERYDAAGGAPLSALAAGLYSKYAACMEAIDYSGALAAVMELCNRANLYIEETAPWALAKAGDTEQLGYVLYNLLEAIRVMALFYAPVMPATSAEVYRRLGLGAITEAGALQDAARWGQLPAGQQTEGGVPLFPRIKEDEL